MKVFNDDEEPIFATQTQDVSSGDKGSSSRTDRLKVKIINKSEAPLEETKFKVMLELIGNESGNERPGLDLVIVLDRSMSMKGEKLEKMKLAMQSVIKKLSPIDRLSIVTFCGNSKRLCPLRLMTENSQAEIEKLVNNIVARGKTNIYAGLKKGSRVLKDRGFTIGRVDAIMLLSDGPPDQQYKDVPQVPVDKVPVYTFGLGADYDPTVLNAIANKSSGGTFTDVQNEDNLSIAFSQCLDGLLTMAVQDLKVTFTQQNSTIENVSTGNYPQSNDVGSVTVLLGDLYEKELRKVIVDLLLPAVSTTQNGTDVLQISYTYSIGEEPVEGKPIFSSVNRVLTSNEPEREELKTEEICNKTVQSIKKARDMADMQKLGDAKDIIVKAQKLLEDEEKTWLEDGVDEPKTLMEMLKYELEQLLNLMETKDIYNNLGRSFALSCETPHDRQRFAAKGISSRTKVKIINKSEAPLEETKFNLMLELTGNESGNQRPALDLVTVLDVSLSMRGERLEKMKNAMQSVIKKLNPIDRLSVVTFSSDSKILCPLCYLNENSRACIEGLVKHLEAQDQKGPGDISAGLEMGLKVLNHSMYTTTGRLVAIMLLSDGGQNPNEVDVGNVPVYTFGLDTDLKLLKSIADNSSGGTFTNVQNLDNLSEEFSQCLARLLTVEVHDLKVTFEQVKVTYEQVNSVIKKVYAGNHPQSNSTDNDVGSVTVSFGNLYKKETHEVNVDLLLPDVSSTQCVNILRISYTYSFGGNLIGTNPRIVTITRRNSEPMINEARVVTDKQVEVANKMISEAQKLLPNVVDEILNSEVQQLKRLINSQKLYNEQEKSEEVTIDEIHLLAAESGDGTIRSLEASTVHSNNDVKKPIEFLLDRTQIRERIPQLLNRSNNYLDWSKKLKQELQELNVWKMIEEASIETTESIENVDICTAIKNLRQFRENWMALILINQACGFPKNLQIIDLHSARAAWDTLATNGNQGGSDVEREFLTAVERGDWKNAERLLDSSPNHGLAKARIPSSQNTVLHLASLAGEVNIVKKLVRFMTEEDLEIQDKDGYTALAKASINGDKRIAQCMFEKNKKLVSICTGTELLPVVIAMMYGNKEMVLYLYSKKPQKVRDLLDKKGNINGATLLTYSIKMQLYDISFHLIKKCPHLAVALDHNGQSALYQLAYTPSAFGSKLNFWQKWMYYCVPVQDVNWDINETWLSVQDEDVRQSNGRNTWYRGISGIYEMKLVHRQSARLLRCICEQIKEDLDNNEINGIINALHEAAARGVVEFVVEVLKEFPEFRWLRDKDGCTIFMKAVQFRQADVFCLIHEFPSKDKMVVLVDKNEENIFHKLKYSSVDKISTIQGGLIKMQTELKWLEEIKSMMPPDSLKKQNNKNKTAQELFDESHEDLMMYAEMGMKKTSESCIIVGILVVTIMFAAVFTVPGGNNQDTGLPLFLNINLFKIFIISVAVSLCFSTASVLMFLGILTSRYARKDFLEPLPRKMIIALLTLFISITAMMVAFTVTLFIMLRSELRISLPIIVSLASFPVILSAIFMFPLLSEYIMSTYGPSIFKRKSKLLLSG